MSDTPLVRSELDLKLLHRGKVRDVYEVDHETLLMVASDRVSAFDVVLPQPIPSKGEVLTLLTAWWMKQLDGRVRHHLLAVDPDVVVERHPALEPTRGLWERRSMLVRRTRPVLVECVVRGYISGSAWKEYRTGGTLAGEALPSGLRESEKLDAPIFSPATKAQEGHDENVTYAEVERLLGLDLAARLRDLSLEIYAFGRGVAEKHGIILADTKLEFGHDPDGRLLLIDEVLTPDSSRFWPRASYTPGHAVPSFDKQFVRDYLEEIRWNKQPPVPTLPDEVVRKTREKYIEAFRLLSGRELR
jgi:phosphoribosylaminoimidazole-succinocarboxamide synthase